MFSHAPKNCAVLRRATLLLLLIIFSCPVRAAFYYRGDGMLYDSERNLTWLLDASYSLVQDLSSDGTVTWIQAVSFADNFTHAGYDDWRLPSVRITNADFKYSGSDRGFKVLTDNSELAYLYYDVFRNGIPYDEAGNYINGWGYEQPGRGGIFNNFQVHDSTTNSPMQFRPLRRPTTAPYWVKGGEDSANAWTFDMYFGVQQPQPISGKAAVWLVRNGDVQPQQGVPPQVTPDFTGAVGIVRRSTVRLTGRATNVESRFSVVEISVNGGPWEIATGTSTWQLEPRLNLGSNTVVIRALGKSAQAPYVTRELRREIPSGISTRDGFTEYNTSFTDSSGRTALYRYSIKDGWNTSQPRGLLIYFHGNNTGLEETVLDGFTPGNRLNAFERDLIPVNIASPYARPASLVRQWMSGDKAMLHELLQSKLGGNVVIDYNKIIFAGGSQGTCFLHDFLMDYAEHYGGGFFAGCGCFNSPDPLVTTSDALKNRFKVYVHNTTGDFLHETGQSGYGYYRYTLGLKTVGDFSIAGEHCSAVSSVEDKAYDWLLGRIELPVLDEYPRWERMSLVDANDVAIDKHGVLWAAEQTTPTDTTILYSRNEGRNWQKFATVSGDATDLEAVGDYLFLGTTTGLHRSSLRAANFTLIGGAVVPNGLVSDGNTRLFNYDSMRVSKNYGDTWESLGSLGNENTTGLPGPRLSSIFSENTGFRFLDHAAAIADKYQSRLAKLPFTTLASVTDDGERWWALGWTVGSPSYYLKLFVSADLGLNWKEATLPPQVQNADSTFDRVTSLPNGEILLHAGHPSAATSWLSTDKGATWQRVRGLETVSWAAETVGSNDGKRLYMEDRGALFSLKRSAIETPVAATGPAPLSALFNGSLIIPELKLNGRYYHAELKLTNPQLLEFTLVAAALLPYTPEPGMPEYVGGLTIPMIQFGQRQFSAVLEVSGGSPLKFKVTSYKEIR